ncbi:MAG: PilZ domain-containing protein [Acidobacteria bacterium]|nr:PilZ domain-containing protein [Acidobacteriota bacterium]
MEKRTTPRIPVNARAVVQTLGGAPETNGQPVKVAIVDASHRGMRLQSEIAMKPGDAVKIEIEEAMFLGELCYCTPRTGGGFHIGVVTEQCLTGLSSLQHLTQAVASAPNPAPAKAAETRMLFFD